MTGFTHIYKEAAVDFKFDEEKNEWKISAKINDKLYTAIEDFKEYPFSNVDELSVIKFIIEHMSEFYEYVPYNCAIVIDWIFEYELIFEINLQNYEHMLELENEKLRETVANQREIIADLEKKLLACEIKLSLDN